jgi:hypothetical protein
MGVANNDDDGAQTLEDSCHLTSITGVVQSTIIYDQSWDPFSGN